MGYKSPGQVAQLAKALSQYIKVMGLIPNQGIYKNQPTSMINVDQQMDISLSLKAKNKNKKIKIIRINKRIKN